MGPRNSSLLIMLVAGLPGLWAIFLASVVSSCGTERARMRKLSRSMDKYLRTQALGAIYIMSDILRGSAGHERCDWKHKCSKVPRASQCWTTRVQRESQPAETAE